MAIRVDHIYFKIGIEASRSQQIFRFFSIDSMPFNFNAAGVNPFLQVPLIVFPSPWPGISDVQGGLSEGGTFLLHMDGVSVPITFSDVKPMLG